jgi:hypothetical protein
MTTKEYKVQILTEFMTLTSDEDKDLLQEVISQEKIKRPRGRPGAGLTDEELRLRKRNYDKKYYHQNPQKKIDAVMLKYVYKKLHNMN